MAVADSRQIAGLLGTSLIAGIIIESMNPEVFSNTSAHAATRSTFWGAMVLTAGIRALFGVAVSPLSDRDGNVLNFPVPGWPARFDCLRRSRDTSIFALDWHAIVR